MRGVSSSRDLRSSWLTDRLLASIMGVGIGYLVMRGGSDLLKEADRVPTEEEDTEAMEANLDTNK